MSQLCRIKMLIGWWNVLGIWMLPVEKPNQERLHDQAIAALNRALETRCGGAAFAEGLT